MRFSRWATSVSAISAIACTHTVEGTGATGTSSSSGSTPTDCSQVAGNWEVRGATVSACGADSCRIAQTGCSVTLSCAGGIFAGTINGSVISWNRADGAPCSATVTYGVLNRRADGTCRPSTGTTCAFSATER